MDDERYRGVGKCLLGVFCGKCIDGVVISLDYLFYLLCIVYGRMCTTPRFKSRGYIYNPSYFRHQIQNINLSLCCIFCPWLCTYVGCTIYFVGCKIPGKLGFHLNYRAFNYVCIWLGALWPRRRIRLFTHYIISLSSSSGLIWKHWTYKILVKSIEFCRLYV